MQYRIVSGGRTVGLTTNQMRAFNLAEEYTSLGHVAYAQELTGDCRRIVCDETGWVTVERKRKKEPPSRSREAAPDWNPKAGNGHRNRSRTRKGS